MATLLRAQPNVSIISVSQSDDKVVKNSSSPIGYTIHSGECRTGQDLIETVKEGSPMAPMLQTVNFIADAIAKAMSFYVAYGGNEQTDSSVGFDPQPHLDTDGRDGGVELADYGKSFGETICSPLGSTACGQTAGCTWGSVSGSTVCYWSGSRPDYFARTTAPRKSTYTTVIRHYVETQDTLDNMQGTGFVQWNKHGGIYTYGNAERFPFGINRYSGAPEYAKLDETGSSTWGYSKYESLYGYGYYKNGVWSTCMAICTWVTVTVGPRGRPRRLVTLGA